MSNELSYYRLYLLQLLQDIGDERAADDTFLVELSEAAEQTFEDSRRSGLDYHTAKERAMRVLLDGLYEE